VVVWVSDPSYTGDIGKRIKVQGWAKLQMTLPEKEFKHKGLRV
jgi:hypothetical protein